MLWEVHLIKFPGKGEDEIHRGRSREQANGIVKDMMLGNHDVETVKVYDDEGKLFAELDGQETRKKIEAD